MKVLVTINKDGRILSLSPLENKILSEGEVPDNMKAGVDLSEYELSEERDITVHTVEIDEKMYREGIDKMEELESKIKSQIKPSY
jgi:hypothetical protein